MIPSPERLLGEALAIRNHIIGANLRLVVSIAKTRVGPAGNLFELVSDDNMSLIRAVERFDYARGFKFSTYAFWTITEEKSRCARFADGHKEMFAACVDHRVCKRECERDHRRDQRSGRVIDSEKISRPVDPNHVSGAVCW